MNKMEGRRMKCYILLCVAGVIFCTNLVEGADSPYTIMKFGSGARSSGIGHGFVAIADDASSIYWNPAGLGQLDRQGFSFTVMNMNHERQYINMSYVCPELKEFGAIGVGLMQLGVSDIKRTGRDQYGEMIRLGSFESKEMALLISYGREVLRHMLYAGANLKIFNHQLGDYSGNGFGIDVGLLSNVSYAFNRVDRPFFGFMDDVKIGIIVSNNTPKKWDLGHEDEDALNGTLALAFIPLKNEDYSLNTTLSLTQAKKRPMTFSGGCELKCLSLPLPISLWGGMDNLYLEQRDSEVDTSRLNQGKKLSLGIGTGYRIVQMDYTVSFERLGVKHRVTTGINF